MIKKKIDMNDVRDVGGDWLVGGKPPPDWRKWRDEHPDEDPDEPDPTSPQMIKDTTGFDEDEDED